MGNMSYCRFENTADDLDDCWEHFDNADDLSHSEAKARRRIIQLACEIAESYADEVGLHVEVASLK
jgi:hypothetical protein